MKEGWATQELKSISKIMYGHTAKASGDIEGPKYLRITDIQNNRVDWNVVPSCPLLIEDYDKYELKYGDIVFARTGATTGKSFLIKECPEAVFASYLIRVQPDQEKISPDFLYLFFQSQKYWNVIESGISGSAQGGFNAKKLGSISIPIPPPSEQKEIVKILDEAFAKIDEAKANIEKNIENARELFQSRLNAIFSRKGEGWVESTIGQQCSLMTGGTPSKEKDEYFKNGTINWLVSGDIHKKNITECDGKITQLGLENSNAKYLPLNSIMIALNGQGKTRGTVAMLKIKATCNQSLVSIYPNDANKILPEYIYTNLNSRYDEIRKMTGDSGNDRRGLNMPLIRRIKFSFPQDVEEQKKIVKLQNELNDSLENLENYYNQKLTNLEELKKSLLQKAFAGELT